MTWAHILFAAVAALLAFLAWLLLFHPLHDHPYREETDELTDRRRARDLPVDRPGEDEQWATVSFRDTVPNIQRAQLAETAAEMEDR